MRTTSVRADEVRSSAVRPPTRIQPFPSGSGTTSERQRPSDVPGKLLTERLLGPGERAEVEFELGHAVALEAGMRFAMREGGRTVGAGIVSRVS